MTNANLKQVLLVDDEPNLITILVESLEALGENYIFHTAKDGTEALEKIREHTYDLVITDYMMPNMNGIALASHIRKISPDTQVIMMTAHGSVGLQEAVGSLKLDGYIDKPVSIKRIREIVKNAVGQAYEGEDPYRSGERQLEENSYQPIYDLQINTNARAVLLLSAGGYMLGMAGHTQGLDIDGIGALVAANFMAASELAKLLGNDSVFKSSYHEGPDYDIYANDINGDVLLAVIFGSESKTGMVRYYATKAVDELKPLLVESPKQDLPANMSADIAQGLDDLFG